MLNIALSGYEISVTNLTKDQTKLIPELKGNHYVYFLICSDEIIYIGFSRSIFLRFQEHRCNVRHLPKKEFDRVVMLQYKNNAVAGAMERVYHKKYPTPYNNPMWTMKYTYADLDFLNEGFVKSVSFLYSDRNYSSYINSHPKKNENIFNL